MDNLFFDLTASSNARKVPILDPDYPADVTMKATDGSAKFAVVITKQGRPGRYSYQWYANGVAVEGETGDTYVRDVSEDKGLYKIWCEVTNNAGTVRTREATLTVTKVPVLDASYPVDVSCAIKDNVAPAAVKFAESGYPDSYTYQWYANDAPVAGATGSTFNLSSDTVGTWKIYCVVTNEAGSVKTRISTVTVNVKWIYSNGVSDGGVSGYGWYDAYLNPNNFASVTVENGNLVLNAIGPNANAVAYSNKQYDLTGINTVVFGLSAMIATNPQNTTYAKFGVSNGLGSVGAPDYSFAAVTTIIPFNHSGSLTYIAVDVSALNGFYHIKATLERNYYYEDHIYINQIYLS